MRLRVRRGARARSRRLSIHLRLFLGFGSALAVCAALMVAIIYVGIRYVPEYDLATAIPGPTPRDGDVGETHPTYALEDVRGLDGSGLIRTKEDVWSAVLAVSVTGVLLVTAVGLAGGWLVSRRLLAPLHAINRAAAKAGEGVLSYRINAAGPQDELKELADTFDTTLARLEESFDAHQRFAANASHELLTPLATTRAILQMAAADASKEELAELVPMLVETNERNIRIVEELLRLAGVEQVEYDPEPVTLAGLVEEEAGEREGGSVRLAAVAEGDGEVRGNLALLRQMVRNLLDNAVRHNVADGTVRVRVAEAGERVVLEVDNTGPVVDPDVVDRLFEPFYRAQPRVGSERGHGLGLAIVRAVVRAHGGTVTARAKPEGGLTVRVTLPAAYGC
ncbi:sensor histidine kinase [Streptomyces sp. NPDC004726]